MVVCAVEGKDHVAQEAEVFLQEVISFLGLFKQERWRGVKNGPSKGSA